MFSPRPRFRSLLALAAIACIGLGEFCYGLIDSAAALMRSGFAFVVNLFAGMAPARADELAPLERVKLTASESHAMAVAKRERPLIFAGWRMSPST